MPGVGGRSIAWTAWIPEPLATELASWPDSIVTDIRKYIPIAVQLFKTDRISNHWKGSLHKWIGHRLPPEGADCSVEDAPLAVNATTGLTFSGNDLLARHIPLQDIRPAEVCGTKNLSVLSACQITSMITASGAIVGISTNLGEIAFGGHCQVVVALSAIESFALLAKSISGYPKQTEVRGHVISGVRAQTSAEHHIVGGFENSGYLLRGGVEDRHFHLQLTACSGVIDWRTMPLSVVFAGGYGDQLVADTSRDSIQIGIAALLEAGTHSSSLGTVEFDPHNNGIACRLNRTDQLLADWECMDKSTDTLIEHMKLDLHFRHGNSTWVRSLPSHDFDATTGRRLSTVVHESSTIPFPRIDSISDETIDEFGQVRGIRNLFVAGRSTFPTVGSHNGSLLAASLALRLADYVGVRI